MFRLLSHRQSTLIPFVLLFGIFVTIVLVYSAVSYSIDRDRGINLTSSIHIKDLLERKINLLNEVIHSMRILFDASSDVEADEFRLMSQDLLIRHPYVLLTNYLPLVSSDRVNIFEEKMLDQGFITFTITQFEDNEFVPTQKRSRYFPVLYIEPFTPLSAKQLGLDYLSHPILEKAINKAIDSSAAVASTPIKLGSSDIEFIIFKAVYAGKDSPKTVEQRRKTVNGLIALHIDASALLTVDVNDSSKNIKLSLLPDSNSAITIDLAAYDQAIQQNSYKAIKQFSHTFSIESEGQSYVLTIKEPLYWSKLELKLPIAALLTGLILTIFLVVQMRTVIKRKESLEKRNEEIQAVVLQRTRELEFEKELAQTTLESISDAVITTNASGNIQYMNPVAEAMTGWNKKEAIERPITEIFNIIQKKGGKLVTNPVQDCLNKDRVIQLNDFESLLDKFGESVAFESAASPLKDKNDKIIGAVLVAHDVGNTRKMAKLMKHQATHDALTGLPNRALLLDRLKQALLRAPWNQKCIAVIFLDLDRFKVVNDTLGHDAGDQLLCQVAERLKNGLRDGDTVCRLGGDEFVIILCDIGHQNHIEELAEKMVEILREPFQLDEAEFHTSASLGISMFPQDGHDPDTLMKKADTAMYKAKAKGKSTYALYKKEMGRCDANNLNREMELHHAIKRNELILYYQPQIEMKSGRVICVEALVRWQHPSRGLLSPGEFLPLAKEIGLMAPIGQWVLERATQQCVERLRWSSSPVRVAVNISDAQFQKGKLHHDVQHVLDASGLAPSLLELELTEGILANDADAATKMLKKLREMGVSLSIDDFGTGYSSFSYLKRFPLSILKVDHSFIKDIVDDTDDEAICSAIIAMAHNLHLKVVAEGVENAQQLEILGLCHIE